MERLDIDRIFSMRNRVQTYAWGSSSAIPLLQGRTPQPGSPEAELWMGAHPKAPSLIQVDSDWIPMDKIIAAYPVDFLGTKTAAMFGGKLPYLFKVLAAARPLSLQVHPDANQAKRGFERENKAGVPFEAPHRNYKDGNHKPECICALTEFWALCGFRKASEILTLASPIVSVEFDRLLKILKSKPDSEGLQRFFCEMMTQPSETSAQMVREAVSGARCVAEKDPVYRWMAALADAYPGDKGVLAPLFLNLIKLRPGEALYLSAGELHAYLEGVGIELMANSDNVLRGGLTPKHVDVPELLQVLDFSERELQVLSPQAAPCGEAIYPCGAKEFELSVLTVDRQTVYHSDDQRSMEIILCTSGKSTVTDSQNRQSVALDKGTSVAVPSALKGYNITGEAVLYKASVPL